MRTHRIRPLKQWRHADPNRSEIRDQRSDTPTVLHVRIVTETGGGPDKTILRSAKYIDGKRYRVAAAYIHNADDPGIHTLEQQARELGMPFHAIPERGKFDLTAIRQLLRLCRQLNVAIWHGHDYKSDLLGVALRRLHRMKLVTTAHGFTRPTPVTQLYYKLDDLSFRAFDHVVTVSPTLLEHCVAQGVHPDRVSYVPNAIELDQYPRTMDRDRAKQCFGVDPARLVIGIVCRLSPEKGLERAIRLMNDLSHPPRARHCDAVPGSAHNVELHIIGDGNQRDHLEAMAREFNLGERVKFFGWQTDPRPYYQMMDLLLIPSLREGMPNSALEAMAMHVPVAATAIDGLPDLFDGGRFGILLDPDDDSAWLAPITRLLTHPAERAALAHRARRRIEQRHTFKARMQRIVEIYDKVLGTGDGQHRRAA